MKLLQGSCENRRPALTADLRLGATRIFHLPKTHPYVVGDSPAVSIVKMSTKTALIAVRCCLCC